MGSQAHEALAAQVSNQSYTWTKHEEEAFDVPSLRPSSPSATVKMELSGHRHKKGSSRPFHTPHVNRRHRRHRDKLELPIEEKVEPVDESTMEAFLDDQEQKSDMSTDTSNTGSEAEEPSLIDIVKDGFNQINGTLSALSKQVHDLKSSKEIARIKKQLEDVTEQNRSLSAENTALQVTIEATNKNLEKAIRDRNAQPLNADGETLVNSRKTTDDTVRSKWKQLDYNIRCLAHDLAASPPSTIMGSLSETLRCLHPSWRKFLDDDDYREPFLERYLWHVVTNQVFDASANIYGGQSSIPRSLKYTQKKMMARALKFEHHAPLYQRLARWRAQGSALFEELWDINEKQLNDVISTETGLLRPFWSEKPGSADRSEVKAWDGMKAILEGALELDRLLMGSKAIFKACWENYFQKTANPLPYNPHKMDVVASNHPISARSQVTFFTSPVLFKVGNGDGQNYDKVMVLAKASVVCD